MEIPPDKEGVNALQGELDQRAFPSLRSTQAAVSGENSHLGSPKQLYKQEGEATLWIFKEGGNVLLLCSQPGERKLEDNEDPGKWTV